MGVTVARVGAHILARVKASGPQNHSDALNLFVEWKLRLETHR